jgi:hypothetical protein
MQDVCYIFLLSLRNGITFDIFAKGSAQKKAIAISKLALRENGGMKIPGYRWRERNPTLLVNLYMVLYERKKERNNKQNYKNSKPLAV